MLEQAEHQQRDRDNSDPERGEEDRGTTHGRCAAREASAMFAIVVGLFTTFMLGSWQRSQVSPSRSPTVSRSIF